MVAGALSAVYHAHSHQVLPDAANHRSQTTCGQNVCSEPGVQRQRLPGTSDQPGGAMIGGLMSHRGLGVAIVTLGSQTFGCGLRG
jgi:hypothetical protein